MNSATDRPLPEEPRSGGSYPKLASLVLVAVMVVASLGSVLLLGKGGDTPSASFAASKTSVSVGETVQFDASGSKAPSGTILSYVWNFGDNTRVTTSGPLIDHTYSIPGAIIVGLTITTDKGTYATSDVVRITVNPSTADAANDSAPVASITSSIELAGNTLAPGASAIFDGKNSYAYTWNGTGFEADGAAITGYAWTFGDGGEASGISATHSWSQTDIYGVVLTVTKEGSVNTTSQSMVSVWVKSSSLLPLTRADTFVKATNAEPRTVDPAVCTDTAGGEIIQNAYQTLVWYDGASATELRPVLATNVPSLEDGTISDDGLVYTYHIRTDVKFHSGNILTPEDVEYSLERVLLMGQAPAWILAQFVVPDWSTGTPVTPAQADAAIEVEGNDVIITLVRPYPAFNYVMATTVTSIVEKAQVEAHGGVEAGETNAWMSRNDAGTGPFTLAEWVPNQYVRMDRFDQYWEAPASLKHVFIKQVKDLGTREMMLFSGDADTAYIDRQHASDVAGRTELKSVVGLPSFSINFVGLNQNIVASDLNVGVPSDFFSDVHVRRAFAYAFDYASFINDYMLGTASQPNSAIPEGMLHYNASLPVYQLDLEKAREELRQASDGKGGNYFDAGFTISIYYNVESPERRAQCDLLKTGLEAISDRIEVNVVALSFSSYYSHLLANHFSAFIGAWQSDYADPDDNVLPFYHIGGTYAAAVGLDNETLSGMAKQASETLDYYERQQLYDAIAMSSYENAYYIFTSQPDVFHVERAWVQGYHYNPMHMGLYYYALSKG